MNKKTNDKMLGLPRRHISWSQLSSLDWGNYKETYIWQKQQSSPYLLLGKQFAEAMEHRSTKVPEYIDAIRRQIPDFPKKEVEFSADIQGIPVIGYFDSLDCANETIIEFKTGGKSAEKFWRNGQLSLYALLYFQKYKKMPKNVKLYWAKTQINENEQLVFTQDKVKEFNFNIEIKDILRMTSRIIKAYDDIKQLVELERSKYGSLPIDK